MKNLFIAAIMIGTFTCCTKKVDVKTTVPAVINYRLTTTDTSTYLITYSDSTSKLVTIRFTGNFWSKTITKRSQNLTISDFLVENVDPWIPKLSGQMIILINGQNASNQLIDFNSNDTNFFSYSTVP